MSSGVSFYKAAGKKTKFFARPNAKNKKKKPGLGLGLALGHTVWQ